MMFQVLLSEKCNNSVPKGRLENFLQFWNSRAITACNENSCAQDSSI